MMVPVADRTPELPVSERQSGNQRLGGVVEAHMMRRLCALIGTLAIVAACGSGASAQTEVRADASRRTVSEDAAAPAVTSLHAFTVDLYRTITAGRGDNVVLSPYSIDVAVAMVRAGASGATASEIDRVLHTTKAEELLAGLNAIDRAVQSRAGTYDRPDTSSDSVELRVANALFGQRDAHFEQPFLTTLVENLGAGIRTVDYKRDTEAARREINAWVEDQTHDRIKDLLASGTLDEMTRLVAVNAVYLNAGWKFPFEETLTASTPFHLTDGSTVDAPLMSQSVPMRYAAGAGWQAFELPYVNDKLAMVAIVPDLGTFADFEQHLDVAVLDDVVSQLEDTVVDLRFPKFEFTAQQSLKSALTELGMPTAFSDDADFSRVSRDEFLRLKDVVHQAYIKVNEKGTEAAAATAAIFEAVSGRLGGVSLTVDRPFIFLIRDVPTGVPLFIGRVLNPTG